jgi:nitrous oxidase accessory protein
MRFPFHFIFRIILGASLGVLCMPMANARSLHVGDGHPFLSLKDAFAAAVDADTVIVYGGVYKEGNLILDKSIVCM